MELSLAQKLGLDDIAGRFKLLHPLDGGMSSRSFIATDTHTNQEVFVKLLLFPNSPFEEARFDHEVFVLKTRENAINDSAVRLIASGELLDGNAKYLVTDKVNGATLSSWLADSLPGSNIDDRLEMTHRVISATTFSGAHSHRDLHPGNIMIMDEAAVWDAPVPVPKIKIVDWGHSFSPLYLGYEDTPECLIYLNKQIPRQLSGSFYSTPPEVFEPWGEVKSFVTKFDAWSLGLMLFKLMSDEDAFRFESIGEYIKAIQSGELEQRLLDAKLKLEKLEHKARYIIALLFNKLTLLNPEHRFDASTAARILWDIRLEGLALDNNLELEKYFSAPHKYKPDGGWRYSDEPDFY